MKKFLFAAAALGALAAAPAQAAVSIDYQAGGNVLAPGLSIIENFNGLAAGTSVGSNAMIHAANSDGNGALPAFGDGSKYLSVLGGGSYTMALAPVSMLSFVLGSLDTYNSVRLSFTDGTTQLLEGAQIKGALTPTPLANSGDQLIPATNGRVTYGANGGPLINGITFLSTGNSFEIDDVATAAVPEPATWAMMLLGFAVIGSSMRTRRREMARAFS